MKQIAILTDSGCNLPLEYCQKEGIYIVPLKMNYSYGEFRDGLDITPQEVYEKLGEEIPTTSLPSMEEVAQKMEEIKGAGYTQVICVHLSSGLSGTFNIVRLVAEEMEGLDVRLIDTKNIGMGAGFLALYAYELIQKGLSLDEIVPQVEEKVADCHVFFCVDTLKYLQKGGRIGLVGSILGTTLNLKPIISCNEDGIYYTVAKVRGKRHGVEKMLSLVEEQGARWGSYDVCVCNGGASQEEMQTFQEEAHRRFQCQNWYATDISPTLGVHTGSGLLGIAIFPREGK